MSIAIRVTNLSKCYRISADCPRGYRTLRETLTDAFSAPLRHLRAGAALGRTQEFHALSDLNFDVAAGEVLGIVGRNGAGKSTLLKILGQITAPTSGQVDLYGRVGSLLEVGTGFHPELTGRENILLNGSILGMSRREILSKFDEIVEFSGVEQFLETPVKRYSSGMRVRLAFAVAAHLEPEILLVDEVLAVGDAEFQRKCLGKNARRGSFRPHGAVRQPQHGGGSEPLHSCFAAGGGTDCQRCGGLDRCRGISPQLCRHFRYARSLSNFDRTEWNR